MLFNTGSVPHYKYGVPGFIKFKKIFNTGSILVFSMIELNKYKKDISQICASLSVQRLELVGSAARDDFQPDTSDIDVLVDFKGNEKLFERYFDLKEQLEKCFGRRVDVIQSSALKNPYVKKSIDCDRIALYES
jgi:uncharacterized protein